MSELTYEFIYDKIRSTTSQNRYTILESILKSLNRKLESKLLINVTDEEFYLLQRVILNSEEVKTAEEKDYLLDQIEKYIEVTKTITYQYERLYTILKDRLDKKPLLGKDKNELIEFNNQDDVIKYISEKENIKEITRASLRNYIKKGWLKSTVISERKSKYKKVDVDEFLYKYRTKLRFMK